MLLVPFCKMQSIHTTVLSKNAKWAIRRCQISFDKYRICRENCGYFFPRFSDNLRMEFNLKHLKISKKKVHECRQRYKFYQGKFGNSRMFLRRPSLARQHTSKTSLRDDNLSANHAQHITVSKLKHRKYSNSMPAGNCSYLGVIFVV